MQKTKIICASEKLSLIDAIEMQVNSAVVLKARGRIGLPHKIVRVKEKCAFMSNYGAVIKLDAGECVAAYRVPKSDYVSGEYWVARLSGKELQLIDAILQRRFASSLAKEEGENVLPCVSNFPCMTIPLNTLRSVGFRSNELYLSDGQGSTKLCAIFQLQENVSFLVLDSSNPKKKHLYRARKDDIFCLLKGNNAKTVRLVPVSKADVPAIKMQDKKEKILRQAENNTATQRILRPIGYGLIRECSKKLTRAQQVLKLIDRKKIQKTRN